MASASQNRLREILEKPDHIEFIEELQRRIESNPRFLDEHADEVVDMTLGNLVSHGHEEEAITDLKREEILETVKEFLSGRK